MTPPRPTGSSAKARFWQWAYDSIQELTPRGGPGVLVDRTTRGVFVRMQQQAHRRREPDDYYELTHPVLFTGLESRDAMPLPTSVRNGNWTGLARGEETISPRYKAIHIEGGQYVYITHPGAAVDLIPGVYSRTKLYTGRSSARVQFTASPNLQAQSGVGSTHLYGMYLRLAVASGDFENRIAASTETFTETIDGEDHFFQRALTSAFLNFSSRTLGAVDPVSGLTKQRGSLALSGFSLADVVEIASEDEPATFYRMDPDASSFEYVDWAPIDHVPPYPALGFTEAEPSILFLPYAGPDFDEEIELPESAQDGTFFFEARYGPHPNVNLFGPAQASTLTLRITPT
jgi:hypothetical protein